MTEQQLKKVLSSALSPPPAVEARLQKIYSDLPHIVKRADAGRGKKIWWRALLLAAAICAALAITCGAVYVALHGTFFQAMFGNSALSRQAETKYDERGQWLYTLPETERVDVDADQAEKLVGAFILELNQSVTVEGYTFTFLNHLYDGASGVGRIYYTVENPNGLDAIRIHAGDYEVSFPGQTGEAGIGPSFFGSLGTLMAVRTYQDPAGSTADRLALCTNYTCEGFVLGESVRVELWTRRPWVQSNLSSQVTPTLAEFDLPVEEGMPNGTCGEGAVSFSAIGAAVDMDKLKLENGEEVHSLVLQFADGEAYVVVDQNRDMNNSAYATQYSTGNGCSVNRTVYAFNRVVDMDNVIAVIVNGISLDVDTEDNR